MKKNFRNDAMQIARIFFGLGCLLAIVGLSSCFYPETFEVRLNIDKSGAYSFAFDGMLVFLSDNQAADEVLLKDQDPTKIAELEKALKKNKSFQEIKYTGKGRFNVRYLREGVIKPDTELKFLDEHCLILTIEPGEPGRIIIKGAAPGTKTMAYLKKMHVNLAGKLTITTNARVIRHNADSGPWLFGLLGSYQWQFALSPFPEPWMYLELQ
jgi:hypothetical protein